MCTDSIVDDFFTAENTSVYFANKALELMICFCPVSGCSHRFSHSHVVDHIKRMNAFENVVVFNQSSSQPSITRMRVKFSDDSALGVFLYE